MAANFASCRNNALRSGRAPPASQDGTGCGRGKVCAETVPVKGCSSRGGWYAPDEMATKRRVRGAGMIATPLLTRQGQDKRGAAFHLDLSQS